jgi:hypothetical protein
MRHVKTFKHAHEIYVGLRSLSGPLYHAEKVYADRASKGRKQR